MYYDFINLLFNKDISMNLFSKKSIFLNTKILLTLLIFHFFIMTFIKFQLGWDLHITFFHSDIWNLWKDIYLFFIYILIIWYTLKNNLLKQKIIENKKLNILFGIILLFSLIITLLNFHWLKWLIIWFKYDLWFLFPIIFFPLIDWNKKDINKLYRLVIDLIKTVIVLCIIFAIIRFTHPEFLFFFGYGPLWDWTNMWYPPMLFQTWLDWIQRLSGIFSWPNHMAFYFIAFGPIILFSILSKKIHYIWWILYIILLFWTLSRSWILSFLVEIFIISLFLFKYYKNLRKFILSWFIAVWVGILSLGSYLYFSWKYNQIILRWASTKWHIIRSENTIKTIIHNPFWHGIWTAWPAAHYVKNDIIPESWFLQIFYELWIFWWLLWFIFVFYIIFLIYKDIKINYPYLQNKDILKISLTIWMLWLLFQGLVLHCFEDSMTSLPLFIIIWIILSLNNNNATKS